MSNPTSLPAGDRSASAGPVRPPSLWLKRLGFVFVVLALIVAAGTLARKTLPSADSSTHLTYTVGRSNLNVTVTENGTLESSNNKEIKCLVKGGSTVLWVIETGTMVEPGDELVKLDQSLIEDNITRQKITYENALANKITTESDVAVAETSIIEYIEGTYLEERSAIEKEIFDAEQAVTRAELEYNSSLRLAAKGLISRLQLQGDKFSVDSARKELQLKQTRLIALDKYKKVKVLQQLRSTLRATQARLASDEASLELEKSSLEREKEQLKNCVIRAETGGMVIFPSAAEWKETPDIEEGARVREQQTLLMIPDVGQMQVKVGIHESKIERLSVGMRASVQLQDITLDGTVDSIAEVTRPAGWWTGNMVKYDTIIKIDPRPGLKPGMSAIVDVVLADHHDVLTVPVAAIIESDDEFLVWVKTEDSVQRRTITIADSNDEFTIVTAGLTAGDELILNPAAFTDEARLEALKPATSEGLAAKAAGGKKTAKQGK